MCLEASSTHPTLLKKKSLLSLVTEMNMHVVIHSGCVQGSMAFYNNSLCQILLALIFTGITQVIILTYSYNLIL